MDSYRYVFKFMINGSQGVGKSSFMKQFIDQKFNLKYDQTIGVEFGSKILNIRQTGIKLQIWDTAGADPEQFRWMIISQYRDAICAFIVYDVTSRDSFRYANIMIEEIRRYYHKQSIPVLVANKIDLPNRVISTDEGAQLAYEKNLLYFETSARLNVDNVFIHVTGLILEKIESGEIDIGDESIGIKYRPLLSKAAPPTKRYQNCF